MKECHKLQVTTALISGPGPTYVLGAVRCGERKYFLVARCRVSYLEV